jgi:hypothetical protein
MTQWMVCQEKNDILEKKLTFGDSLPERLLMWFFHLDQKVIVGRI